MSEDDSSKGLFLDNSSQGLFLDNSSQGLFLDDSSQGLFLDDSSEGLFLEDSSLFLNQTTAINQPVDSAYWVLQCVISVLTIGVNSWAIRLLMNKEKELTSNIVICDCVSNIVISFDLIFDFSFGWRPINIPAVCAVQSSIVAVLSVFNRLVPVAIVLLRYIMVCQPAFYMNNGKEGIWKWIVGSMVLLCLSNWAYVIIVSPDRMRFLRCMGREEAFW